MSCNHLILCRPLLPPSNFPSIRVCSNESVLHIKWPEYWSFSFNISPSNEHPGLISFRMDWLELLAVQATLKSLLQHHSLKTSILHHSAFFRRKQWHPTLVLLPEKSHGRRSLVGRSPWGHEESDMTEQLHFHFSLSCIGEGNGNPLHCSCLENPRDRGAWWAAIYGVAQSRTRLKRLSSSSSNFVYSPTLTSIHDTGKTIALTRWTFVGKIMSLLFNMLSRLVITFLSRSKRLLISWLQSPSAVILEPKK